MKGFGWGELKRPMTLFVGDRATFEADGEKLPVEETMREAVDAWVATQLPRVRPGQDLEVRSVLAPGSVELRRIFDAAAAVVSNDTSGASGHAPLLSQRLAHLVHLRCPELLEVYVQVILPEWFALHDVEESIRDVVETEVARLPVFREELLRGEHPVS